MDRERLESWCERGILGLVLAIMIFAPLATGAVRAIDFSIVLALTSGVLALWGVRLWAAENPKLLCPPFCWAVLAFAAYAVARYAACDLEYPGRLELLRVLVYTSLFFAILNNLHRQESLRIVTFTMVGLAMLISCYALYQFITGSDRVWNFISLYKGRASGTYICPNHLGGFLEMLLPLALSYALVGRLKIVPKIVLIYAALVMVAGIGVTISRGSWVAATLALLALFAVMSLHRNYRAPGMVAMVILIAGSTFFVTRSEFFKARWRQTVSSGHVDLDVRYVIWQSTARMWQDHFWWGVGPGHYDYRWREYRPIEVQLRADRAHNEYLNILSDWGTVGGALTGAALLVLLAGALKTWPHVRRAETAFGRGESDKFAFYLGAAFGLFALLIHSTVDFNMRIPANAIVATALMALLASQLRHASGSYWLRPGTVARALMCLTMLALIALFCVQGVRLGREFVWLDRAETVSYGSPEQRELLLKAYEIEPKNFETTQAVGETYRLKCFEGDDDYAEMATNAISWYAKGKALNPYDGYNHLYTGMCLDKLDRHEEAR
ncbi:MAG: O-antigen ligase family protein, partial [Verrucomicrobia bacterium]